MAVPTISVGRMLLREDFSVGEAGNSTRGRAMSISGQESVPRWTADGVVRQREDLLSMAGQFVPITFTNKTYLNGFYQIESVSGGIEDWHDGMRVFPWDLSLVRYGTPSEVDIESRLGGSITRQNNFTVTGQRTHAPSIGHYAYWSDATVTSVVTRVSADGNIKLYRGLGAEISPRWAVNPLDYLKGRVRFFDDLGFERSGSSLYCPGNDWELNNGLLRIRPLASGGVIEVSVWAGSAWEVKNWDVTADGVTLGSFDTCTVMMNRIECVTIRLMKAMTSGRFYMDLTLRRGFRLVDIFLQSEFGVDMKIARSAVESGTNTSGYVVATSNDADGNKYIVGSARTFVADTSNGGISKDNTDVMDAYIGVVLGGTGAASGDAAADLQTQYIGAPTEMVQAVQR